MADVATLDIDAIEARARALLPYAGGWAEVLALVGEIRRLREDVRVLAAAVHECAAACRICMEVRDG